MQENSFLENVLTRIYRRGSSYLTVVQKVVPTGYMTIHTIFDNTFNFTLYPAIHEELSDVISFCLRFQKSKQLYCSFIEKEEMVDEKLHYKKLWEAKGESIGEALVLLEEKIQMEKGLGR